MKKTYPKPLVSKIPHKLSAAIRAAVNDLSRVERSSKYKVRMFDWHTGWFSNICEVCFAGAFLAGTCQLDPRVPYSPQEVPASRTARAMYALNSIRTGDIHGAVMEWPWARRKVNLGYMGVTPYYPDNSAAFKRDMRKIASMLEKVGL